MSTVSVRDIVNDVDAAIAFYCTRMFAIARFSTPTATRSDSGHRSQAEREARKMKASLVPAFGSATRSAPVGMGRRA